MSSEENTIYMLVARLREVLGDNGKRMGPELVEYAREVKARADEVTRLRAEVKRLRAENRKLVDLARRCSATAVENINLRAVLREIADAGGFDNIGKWARNCARKALTPNAALSDAGQKPADEPSSQPGVRSNA